MTTAAAEAPGTAVARVPSLHWPEYMMEAVLLGTFMVSACGFTTLLEHPASPVHLALANPFVRRILMGLAMGGTAVSLIYSPWGRQSGAHFNPATTLTFFRLGKLARRDAAAYVLAQFLGGALGILVAGAVLGRLVADPKVHFAATVPGPWGRTVAWTAEVAITFLLMSVILRVSNSRFAHWTGAVAGLLVTTYIAFEAPVSGMSLNPARSFASAFGAGDWTGFWIYLTAPPLGMLAAAEVYLRTRGPEAVFCAKLDHDDSKPCIFCEYRGQRGER